MLIKSADNPSLGRMTNSRMIKSGFRKLSAGWSNAWKTVRGGLVKDPCAALSSNSESHLPYYKRGETVQWQRSVKDVWGVRLTEAQNGPPVSQERM